MILVRAAAARNIKNAAVLNIRKPCVIQGSSLYIIFKIIKLRGFYET